MNFGIISTANIARGAVVPAIGKTDHDVLAVGSRDADRAAAFAESFDIPRSYGSYDALLADDALDAVYNPLPNALHAEWTRRAADAGLDVLCEKPLAVDANEARELGDYCDDRGVTLMEAFMYRYHPRTERAGAVVREELGEPRLVSASFQFPLPRGRENVRLDPDLAGGSLMDVGCYAVTAARGFLGEPDRVHATATDTRDCGVDTQLVATLEYDDGAMARLSCGFDTPDRQAYRVETTDGWLATEGAFVPRGEGPTRLSWRSGDREVTETFDPTDQYRLEVEHFAECVASGRRPRTDADYATRTMAVIDACYASIEREQPVEVSVAGD